MPPDVVAQVGGLIVGAISATGYLGVAGLMALESACLPLPSEVIMPFAAYLAATGRLDLALAATAGAVGCNIGSTVAYAVGATGGRRFVARWGRYALLDPGDLDIADRFFARFGAAAVLVGRLLPVVRTFIALPAGIARMPQLPFQLFTFFGSWPWCLGLAYLGYALGARWDSDPTSRRRCTGRTCSSSPSSPAASPGWPGGDSVGAAAERGPAPSRCAASRSAHAAARAARARERA